MVFGADLIFSTVYDSLSSNSFLLREKYPVAGRFELPHEAFLSCAHDYRKTWMSG